MSAKVQGMIEGLLVELAKEEALVTGAYQELTDARTKYNVSTRKYAAVRDMVTELLGFSPYPKDSVEWPAKALQLRPKPFGKWRFIHMKPGDAAVAALKEVEEPITLDEIVERLLGGGMRLLTPRSINAALMRTSGIEKTEDGKYSYKEPEEVEEIKAEDLPF